MPRHAQLLRCPALPSPGPWANCRAGTPAPRCSRQRPGRGFTLLSVLVALVVLAFGLLAMAKSYVAITSAGTQNENISSLASYGNAFWGVVQSNQTALLPNMAGAYTNANISAAPAVLQPWLTQVLAPPQGLPQGVVTITTGVDPVSGAACAPFACLVTLTIQWQANANVLNATTARSQTFTYQFMGT